MGWICSFVEPSPFIVVTSVPLTSRRLEDYLDGMDLLLVQAISWMECVCSVVEPGPTHCPIQLMLQAMTSDINITVRRRLQIHGWN
jgi:hypothetical protein